MPIDLSNAWKSGNRILDFVISLLPNILLAVVLFAIFLLLASAAKTLVRRLTQRHGRRQNLGILLGHLAHISVVVFGFLVAFSAVAPSFHASDLIKMLGVGSVAIGFAFQNILQNFLAGILLLLQEPFQIGDWISITGFDGKVEDIQARATVISTADGKRIVIPNAVLFTNPVTVGPEPLKNEEPNPAVAAPQPSKSNA
jgi:small conductance mechanosensitive channel